MDGVLSLNIPRENTNEIVRKERNVQGTLPKTIELEALDSRRSRDDDTIKK